MSPNSPYTEEEYITLMLLDDTRSTHWVLLQVEKLKPTASPAMLVVLNELWKANTLDHIHLILAKALGNDSVVRELTQWINDKEERKRNENDFYPTLD